MTTRTLETKSDVALAITLLESAKLPCTFSLTKGKKRSLEQNRLQHLWHREAAEQLADETAEEKRAYCKLHFGVPILRNESEEYREAYDKVIRPLSYEDKLKLMAIPLDFPCSRLMTMGQKKRYLDDVYAHYKGLGVLLTEPEE